MKTWHRGLLALCVAILSLPVFVAGAAPAGTAHYFAETGHSVRAEFMKFYERNGGLALFGYPISGEVREGGVIIQYFERNRFEYHEDMAGTDWEVMLGLLGTEITEGRDFPTCDPAAVDDPAWYFPETGHLLAPIFRSFWQDRGGLPIFGFPISELLEETSAVDGQVRRVQYFERARFEYHPDLAGTGYEVQLGLLGIELLESSAAGGEVDASRGSLSSRGDRYSDIGGQEDTVALEWEMLDIINADRAAAGIPPLRMDPLITEVAREHIRDMFENNHYSHTGTDGSSPKERMRRAGVDFTWGGENFWGNSNRDRHAALREIEAAMLAEPYHPHVYNHHWMLMHRGYTRIGIGIGIAPNGWLWVVEDFADN